MAHSDMPGADYLEWFYDTGVWKNLQYRGVRILKLPSDLWNYQEIFFQHDIEWVVETGTRHGGSALYFADLLAMKGSRGRVISVDVSADENSVSSYETIDFLVGDSGSAATAERIAAMLPADRGRLFMILDADHSEAHVAKELEHLAPLLRKGDYLVVEDTCVNGRPVRPDFGPGPYEALERYLERHPGTFAVDTARERKFGLTFAPGGYLIKT